MSPQFKKQLKILILVSATVAAFCIYYTKTHPLVFNESFWQHAHCISGAGLALSTYAEANQGRFPSHKNGYGDALLLLDPIVDESLTGPGYDTAVFQRARKSGEDAPEIEFGRVYVQGLSEENSSEIVLLFDKLPTPGGDHCHIFSRLIAPLSREVWMLGGGHRVIPETEWPEFSKQQIELLVAAGIERKVAEMYYNEKAKE